MPAGRVSNNIAHCVQLYDDVRKGIEGGASVKPIRDNLKNCKENVNKHTTSFFRIIFSNEKNRCLK